MSASVKKSGGRWWVMLDGALHTTHYATQAAAATAAQKMVGGLLLFSPITNAIESNKNYGKYAR